LSIVTGVKLNPFAKFREENFVSNPASGRQADRNTERQRKPNEADDLLSLGGKYIEIGASAFF